MHYHVVTSRQRVYLTPSRWRGITPRTFSLLKLCDRTNCACVKDHNPLLPSLWLMLNCSIFKENFNCESQYRLNVTKHTEEVTALFWRRNSVCSCSCQATYKPQKCKQNSKYSKRNQLCTYLMREEMHLYTLVRPWGCTQCVLLSVYVNDIIFTGDLEMSKLLFFNHINDRFVHILEELWFLMKNYNFYVS